MGLLDDIMADDAAYMTDTDEFGETVQYTPSGAPTSNSYSAVVHRGQIEIQDEGSVAESFTVYLRHDSTAEVGPSAIDVGGDKIALKKRIGDDNNTTYTVRHIMSQDTGGWTILAY